MSARIHLAFAVLLVLLGSAATRAAIQSPKTELEGNWVGEKAVVGAGERLLKPGDMTMKFSGDKLLARGIINAEEQLLPFTIKSTARPKQFTFTAEGRTKECLYALDGDKLTLAIPRTGVRPAAIVPDDSMLILTFRRAK